MAKPTRDNILDAADELFSLRGYTAVSVDDLCKAAGVLKGSFYNYFDSKADLAAAALERLWLQAKPQLDASFSPALAPHERIRVFADGLLRWQEEQLQDYKRVCGCTYMTMGNELCTQDEKLRQTLEQISLAYTNYFVQTLEDAKKQNLTEVTDPMATARQIVAFINGLKYQARLTNDLSLMRQDLLPGLERFCAFK